MASFTPPGQGATVTLEANGHRRTWRLDDLAAFVLRPHDVRDLDDLEQPWELTEDFALPAGGGPATRTWSKSPPPQGLRPRTSPRELYHLVRAWLFSRAPSGADDAGLKFLNEELRRHGEEVDLFGFMKAYEYRRERDAEEVEEP